MRYVLKFWLCVGEEGPQYQSPPRRALVLGKFEPSLYFYMVFLWGRRESNSQGFLHTLLRRTRLPVPPRPLTSGVYPVLSLL